MEIIALRRNAPALSDGCVAALGMFDGVHRGHAAVLRRARLFAEESGYASLVWTFKKPPFGAPYITDNIKRAELFGILGMDYAVFEDFEAVKDLSPEAFVADILRGSLNCKKAVCGFNFSFGSHGAGDPRLLASLMQKNGGEAYALPAIESGGAAISSTRIRAAIEAGDIEEAALLLGRPFSVTGEVVGGRMIGRAIGVPTINMEFRESGVIPAFGVYITEAVSGGEAMRGVSNVGIKPTVGGRIRPLCETHILDFCGDWYGRTAEIRFLKYLRPEIKFESLEALCSAIKADIAAARLLKK